MKISVITSNFSVSGVPLAQIRFARALVNHGHEVELIMGCIDPELNFPATPGIVVRTFNKQQARGMLFPLIKYFKNYEPDIIFSAEDHLNAFVLLAAILSGSKAKISCSSRVTPFDTYSNKLFSKGAVLKILMKLVMHRADALTCVSKDMVEQYRMVFNSPPHVCVYNIVDDVHSRMKMFEHLEDPWLAANDNMPILIAAGRLAPWKGFDILIKAMKEVVKTQNAKLLILGDGPSRFELEQLIKENGLDEVIKLMGYVENPLKYYRKADVFVLSSRVEGLPNVLVEAMMCGCTPVSTDCPTGPREVLDGEKYGYLVPVDDPMAMADAIIKAINNPISEALLTEAIKPFAEDVVINRHFEVLGITEYIAHLDNN